MPEIIKKSNLSLIEYFRAHLPQPLVVVSYYEGYSLAPSVHYVEVEGTGRSSTFLGLISAENWHRVAFLSKTADRVDLLDPSWFSTIEDVIAAYEHAAGAAVKMVLAYE